MRPASHSSAPYLSVLSLFITLALTTPSSAQSWWGFGKGSDDSQAAQADRGSIRWVEDPQQALQLARQTGLPVLAYVTSDHCGYCKKMDRETWSSPRVIEALQGRYIPLKLNASKHREAAAALRVTAFPTTLLLRTDGVAVATVPGFQVADRLAPWLAEPTAVAQRQPAVR